MGPWALLLLAGVCVACVASAVGLWRGRRWGHRLAIAGLSINLIGDATNGVLGHAICVPSSACRLSAASSPTC